MRCLQIVLKVLSVSNCSFYTPNKDPDTPAWILILGGTGRAARHLAVWSPISCGLTPCHIPPVALGTAPATWSRLTAGGSASQTSHYPWERKHLMAN